MYAAVPRSTPARASSPARDRRRLRDVSGRQTPAGFDRLRQTEVEHLYNASGRTLMFAGLKSRWMMPCSCAASSASAICLAIGSASSSGIAPRAMRCAGRRPRRVPSRAPARRRILRDRGCAAMFGWFSDASICGFALETARTDQGRWRTSGQDLDRDVAFQLRVASRDRPAPSPLRRSAR